MQKIGDVFKNPVIQAYRQNGKVFIVISSTSSVYLVDDTDYDIAIVDCHPRYVEVPLVAFISSDTAQKSFFMCELKWNVSDGKIVLHTPVNGITGNNYNRLYASNMLMIV